MNRSYKNTVVAILLACILTMAIGYSVLNTRLNIKGTSSITSEFNIQVVGATEFTKYGLAETANVDFTSTSATYSTNINAPGDEAIYEIVIENKGNLDGYVTFNYDEYGYNYYNYSTDGGIYLGVSYVSKTKAIDDDFDWDLEVKSVTLLTPGEKLYVYTRVYFPSRAYELPEQKNFENEVKFTFSQVAIEPIELVFQLGSLILKNEPVVTNGTGLYSADNGYYNYRSDGNGIVNNYVLVDNKMWRIIEFNEDTDAFILIEDEATINSKEAYSTKVGGDGYYNHPAYSTLIDNINNKMYNFGHVYADTEFHTYYYVPDTELISGPNSNLWIDAVLPSIQTVLDTSSNSTCSINTLSTGGCKSWLTKNGNTYLYNPVYDSDKTTNTGNISYLKDDKVISVDPTDAAYGEYKIVSILDISCGRIYITNPDVADGSRENPYIVDTNAMDNVGPC